MAIGTPLPAYGASVIVYERSDTGRLRLNEQFLKNLKLRTSARKLTPLLGQGSSAGLFEGNAAVEMALVFEVIVD